VIAHKQVSLFRTQDATLASLFARADVVSEGSMRAESGGDVWYGSTSVVMTGALLGRDAALLSVDLHTRARVVRLATREARLRAPGALGPVRCEVRVRGVDGGLRIDVDVQAPLIVSRRRAR